MLLVQLPLWLWTTHLYARFAVPLLIPLIIMAGRVPLGLPRARRIAVLLLVIGTLANLAFTTRLYIRHMVPAGDRFNLEGATGFFTGGAGMGHEHLGTINSELPDDACILMIGDAKAFYFQRHVDYCVVFNRSPFIERVRDGASPADLLDWLVESGYTNVLVNWAEVRRLARSRYGFAEEITPELFDRLVLAGLEPLKSVSTQASDHPYAQLYRVPSESSW
jgi:hypothetical protein